MQPQYYYSTPNDRLTRLRRLIIAVVIIVVLAAAGYFVYNQVVFRVSKTDPKTGNMPAAAAFIRIYFNKPITTDGLSLSYSSPFITKYTVGDKVINLQVANGGLTVGKHYSINLNYVASKSGKVIRNKTLGFTAKNIRVSSLSKEQQTALINRQDQYPYASQYINYVGFDTLLDNGLSTQQLTTLKEDIFGYSNQVNQKFWTMTLVPGSLSVKIHDAASDSYTDTYSFKVKLGNDTLTAQAAADPIEDTLGLQLFDDSGTVVYDSINAHD